MKMNREFSKEELKMAKKYLKKCLTAINIREVPIRITLRFHLTQVRMTGINKTTNNKCWRECREKGTLIPYWEDCKLVQLL